jgi:acetyl-CoA acetyltransferase
MRDIAVVGFAQSPFSLANREDDMAEILLPVLRQALDQTGIDRAEIDFYASGSHDFFEGRTFAYIESLDAVGAWPPVQESHVEMDAAWAFYEAWIWLQLGHGDIALVYGIGRGSLAADLGQVMPAQLDPYYLAPLRPHPDTIAALQAAAAIDASLTTERAMAETAARSAQTAADARAGATARPAATDVDELLSAPYVASPLRRHDISPPGDAAAVVVLASQKRAARLSSRPAWIRGMDHRMDTHYPGMRDLTRIDSVRIAASRAGSVSYAASDVDLAELHTEYSHQEALLVAALGLDGVPVNPSGGPLAGRRSTTGSTRCAILTRTSTVRT